MITLYISLAAALVAVTFAVAFALRGGGLDEQWIYVRSMKRPRRTAGFERRRAARATKAVKPLDGPPAAES